MIRFKVQSLKNVQLRPQVYGLNMFRVGDTVKLIEMDSFGPFDAAPFKVKHMNVIEYFSLTELRTMMNTETYNLVLEMLNQKEEK